MQITALNHYVRFWSNEKFIPDHTIVFERARTDKRVTSATETTLHYLHNDHDLAEAFIENYAVFHKFYVSVYNKQKLNQKRKHAKSFYLCDAPENSSESDPTEVQVNRSNVDLRNFLPNCFFCGERDYEEKLHRCEKFDVNKMLRKISHELGDTTIMEKLGEGDMIATEAMYHAKCLVNYYNRCRHQQVNNNGENNNGTLVIMNGNS